MILAVWPLSAQAHGEIWIWWALAGSGGLGGWLAGFCVGALAWRRRGMGTAFVGYLLVLLLLVAVGLPAPGARSLDALALALMVGAAAGVLPFALGFFPGRWLGDWLGRRRRGPADEARASRSARPSDFS